MTEKLRRTKRLLYARANAKSEINHRNGKVYLVLEQEHKHGKTERCPFCGKHHVHGVGPACLNLSSG